MVRLALPVKDVCFVDDQVFVSTASPNQVQLFAFRFSSGPFPSSLLTPLRWNMGPGASGLRAC